jgi:hypothetical protein
LIFITHFLGLCAPFGVVFFTLIIVVPDFIGGLVGPDFIGGLGILVDAFNGGLAAFNGGLGAFNGGLGILDDLAGTTFFGVVFSGFLNPNLVYISSFNRRGVPGDHVVGDALRLIVKVFCG